MDLLFYIRDHLFFNNFHEIVPGRFYRSAQMSQRKLAKVVRRYGIRTVIDLRKKGAPAEHGISEREFVKSLKAEHVHFGMMSTRVPPQSRFKSLVDLLDQSELPILVHCGSGQNRSGVVSAIWLLTSEDAELNAALKQISIRYGHSRIERAVTRWMKRRPLLDEVLHCYRAFFKTHPLAFRQWLEREETARHLAAIGYCPEPSIGEMVLSPSRGVLSSRQSAID